MNPFGRKPKPTALNLPPEPPVGVMVQEMWGSADIWRRTLSGWQMFNRYDGSWTAGTATWEQINSHTTSLVVIDVTAPCREAS